MEEELRELGLDVADSQANFCWVVLGDNEERDVVAALTRAGVAVRPGGALGGEGHLRVTYGTRAENERFIAAHAGRARLSTADASCVGSRPGAGGRRSALYAGSLTRSTTRRPVDTACNGSEHLCDRTLDEVAFAATHNSMSAADQPGWRFTQQERGIPAQLEAGIRGLLIDMYYGIPTSRGVQNIPIAKVDERLGRIPKSRYVYLCHTICAFGATRATDALRDVREFLDDTSPRGDPDQHRGLRAPAGRRRGLRGERAGRATSGASPSSPRFPTLRRDDRQRPRVLVVTENLTARAIPWLRAQFDLFQETPYRFTTPAAVAAGTLLPAQPRQPPEPALPAQQLGRHVAPAAGRATPRVVNDLRTPAAPGPRPASGRVAGSRTWSRSTSTRRATCSASSTRPQPVRAPAGRMAFGAFPATWYKGQSMESAITPATASRTALAAARWPAPFYSWRFS